MPTNLSGDEIQYFDLVFKVLIPGVSFIMGFLVSRFTMSKKERKDYEMQLVKISNELVDEIAKAFQEFTVALNHFVNKEESPDLDDFFKISTTGELYFSKIRIACDAIIARKVDQDSINNTILPKVKEAFERTLPNFYLTLSEIAEKDNIKYSGELRRENYESIFTVYETYCLTSVSKGSSLRSSP